MKRIYIYLALAVLLTGFTGCDKDFEEINTNPVLATTLDPVYLFTNAQYGVAVKYTFISEPYCSADPYTFYRCS